MKSLILSLSLIFSATAFSAPPHSSGTETNGGDGYVAEFMTLAKEFIPSIQVRRLSGSDKELPAKMLAALGEVSLRSVELLELDGREVDAINQPRLNPPTITLSRTKWWQLSVTQKRHLIVHELLPIVGVKDFDYATSSRLLLTSALVTGNDQEIGQAFFLCNEYRLANLKESDIERVRMLVDLRDPVSATVVEGCSRGLEILVNAGFDLNLCQTKDRTPLKSYDLLHEQLAHSGNPRFNTEYRDLLVKAGGSYQCSVVR